MSEKKLDLSVPETGSSGTGKGRAASGFLLLLLLVLTGINTFMLFRKHECRSVNTAGPRLSAFLSPEEERAYAIRLEEKGLYLNAAGAWTNYIHADPSAQKHSILFRIGDCYLKAGNYEQALDSFYRAEQLDTENTLDTSGKIQEALQAIGSYVAIEKDLSDRTSVSGNGNEKVLAEVAGEIITEADLKEEIESQIDLQLGVMKGKVPVDQYNKQKAAVMAKYLDNPQMMEALVQNKVRSLLLYKESRAKNLKETPSEQRMVENMRREMVGSRLLRELVQEQIRISESDIQTWFRANRDEYREQPSVKLRVLTAKDKGSADALYRKVSSNKSSFFGLSDSEPLNRNLDTWIKKGEPVPGIGTHPELTKLYLPETEKGHILEPVEIKGVYYLFQAADKNPGRERSFDEVKEQAARDLYMQKYADAEKALVQKLMKKYKTVIHTEHLRNKNENTKK